MPDHRVMGSGIENVDMLQCPLPASRIRRHGSDISRRTSLGHAYYRRESLPGVSDTDLCHDSVRINIRVHEALP